MQPMPGAALVLLSWGATAAAEPSTHERCASGEAVARAAAGDPLRVGVLTWIEDDAVRASLDGLREGFEVWGVPHVLDVACAESDPERADAALDRFVDEGVRVVVAVGDRAALRAVRRVADRPVFYTAVLDPVGLGISRSLMGSRQNVAGNSHRVDPIEALRVFKDAVPGMRTLGMLHSRATPTASLWALRQARLALDRPGALEVDLVDRAVDPDGGPVDGHDLEEAVRALRDAGAEALWIPSDPTVEARVEEIAVLARRHGLPLVASSPEHVRAGAAVVGVDVDRRLLGQRAVELVREVVATGIDPGRLPVGRLRGVRTVVHLGAARAAGYELPLTLMMTADEMLLDGDLSPGAAPESAGSGDGR